MSKVINVGRVTSYADAVAGGYTGTREQWEHDLANLGTVAAEVEADRAEVAENTATVAEDKAAVEEDRSAAESAAESAASSAASAHTDAIAATAAKEAAQTAQGLAENAASTAANAKDAAQTAQGKAEDAQTAAEAAQTAAEDAQTAAAGSATAAAESATAAAESEATAQHIADMYPTDKTLSVVDKAADGKATGDAVADLKSAVKGQMDDTNSAFESAMTTGQYKTNLAKNWANGNVLVDTTNQTVTIDNSNQYINSGYIDLQGIKKENLSIVVPTGYRLFWRTFDKNDGTYTNAYTSGSWIEAGTYSITRTLYRYIILIVVSASQVTISPLMGYLTKLYNQSSTVLTTDAEVNDYGKKITGVAELSFAYGAINTAGSTVDPTSIVSSTVYKYCLTECSEGDAFTVYGIGGGNYYAWCFADSNNNILASSGPSGTINVDGIVYAPAGTAKAIFNLLDSDGSYVLRGLQATKAENSIASMIRQTEKEKLINNYVRATYLYQNVSDKDFFDFEINEALKTSVLAEASTSPHTVLFSGLNKQKNTNGVIMNWDGTFVKFNGTATENTAYFFVGASNSNPENISVQAGDIVHAYADFAMSSSTKYYVVKCASGAKIYNGPAELIFNSDDTIYGIWLFVYAGNGFVPTGHMRVEVIRPASGYKTLPIIRNDTGLAASEVLLPGEYHVDIRGYNSLRLIAKSWSSASGVTLDIDRLDNTLRKVSEPYGADYTALKPVWNTQIIDVAKKKIFGAYNGKLFGAVLDDGACKFIESGVGDTTFTTGAQIGTETGLPINMERIKGGYLCLGLSGILWRSADGATWTNVLALRKSDNAEQLYRHVYLPGAFQQISTDMRGNIVVNEYRRPERHNTPYSGDNTDGGKVYLSTDDGVTFTTIFDIAVNIGAVTTTHVHSCRIDPYDKTIWIVLGDWPNQKVYWSTDMGVSWNGGADCPLSNNQYTSAISLAGAVIFGTDSHCCGFSRYPKTGGKITNGEIGRGDMPCVIYDFPAGTSAVQPVAGRAGIDYAHNVAMFGFFVSDIDTTYDDFKKGSVYATDGVQTITAFKSDSNVPGGVTTVFYDDYSKCFWARLGTEYGNGTNYNFSLVKIS